MDGRIGNEISNNSINIFNNQNNKKRILRQNVDERNGNNNNYLYTNTQIESVGDSNLQINICSPFNNAQCIQGSISPKSKSINISSDTN